MVGQLSFEYVRQGVHVHAYSFLNFAEIQKALGNRAKEG
jgi:hypothetical protein